MKTVTVTQVETDRLRTELAAWRERFPAYTYRPQDDCVALEKTP